MLTQQIRIDYRMTFDAAFHAGTGLRDGLIHRTVAKDGDGYLFIPGSTVKGVMRDQCSQTARLFGFPDDDPHAAGIGEANPSSTMIELVFGSRFRPGRLFFDDALLIDEDRDLFEPPHQDAHMQSRHRTEFRSWQTEKRTQVSIWRPTGSAHAGRLYNTEYGIRGLRFDGRIAGSLDGYATLTTPPVNYSLILLLAGLYSMTRIGANKSNGFGKLTLEVRQLIVDGQETDAAEMLNKLKELDCELYDLVVTEEMSL